MRYLLKIVVSFAMIISLAGCNHDEILGEEEPAGNAIVIKASLDNMALTRAGSTVADNAAERTVTHLDIFVVYDSGENKGNIAYYERNDSNNNNGSAEDGAFSEVKLEVGINNFDKGQSYKIYLLANTTVSTTDLASITTINSLHELIETTEIIHLTGSNYVESTPKTFLMDAVVKDQTGAESFIINPENRRTEDFILSGELVRAAAKIIVNITQGNYVEFFDELSGAKARYEFNNLAYSTYLLPTIVSTEGGADGSEDVTTPDYIEEIKLKNTAPVNPNEWTFNWDDTNNKFTIVGYSYANSWEEDLTKETSMIVNIPMKWDADGPEVDGVIIDDEAPDSWFRIPLSREKKFERNTCYTVNVTLNTIGNSDINLEDIEFVTQPWTAVSVEIGGEENQAKYLVLNKEVIKIYNSNFDDEQLTFSSSSPIKSIELKDVYKHNHDGTFTVVSKTTSGEGANYEETYAAGDGVYAYYEDKYGTLVQLGEDPGWDISTKDRYTQAVIIDKATLLAREQVILNDHIKAGVPADQVKALNGNIIINSPILADGSENEALNWESHFNTVRYLEFVVTNEQGLTATFRVEQYPLLYIQHRAGFFTYRDDFYGFDDNGNIGGLTHFLERYEAPYSSGIVHALKEIQYFDEEQNMYVPVEGTLEWDYFYCSRAPFLGSDGKQYSREYGELGLEYFGQNEGKLSGKNYNSNKIYRPDGTFEGNSQRVRYAVSKTPWYEEVNGQQVKHRVAFHVYYLNDVQVVTSGTYRGYLECRDWFVSQVEFFTSHFIRDVVTTPAYEGQLVKYYIENGSLWRWDDDHHNNRMYHVRTTSTSNEYTIGIPRMIEEETGNISNDVENSVTEPSADNTRLVSPSFMIGSQLGVTTQFDFSLRYPYLDFISNKYHLDADSELKEELYNRAKLHCKNYVETYFVDLNGDGKWKDVNGNNRYDKEDGDEPVYEFHDWRLPTKAEVDIIVKYQYESRAMDDVMVGEYYMCASPERYTEGGNTSTTKGFFTRCVRDAYVDGRELSYETASNLVMMQNN